MSRLTRRWEGALTATVALGVVGFLAGQPSLLLAGAVPLAYAAYGAVASASIPPELTVERTIAPTPAPPGRAVEIELTVTNGSDRTIADCRVLDGVPEELAVVGGTPRAGITLEPGEDCAITYEVIARRGDHRFDPPTIAVRGLGGGAVARDRPTVAGDARLDCRLDAGAPPLQEEADGFAGQMPTDRPGRGIEFHSVRQYATGDSARRIDWRHYARRGELATVNYEQPGVATVVFVVDARPPSRVVAGPGRPTAVELGAYAGTRALSDLLGSGHDVGVAILGGDGSGPAGLHWLEPGSGADQRSRARKLIRKAARIGSAAGDRRGRSPRSPGRSAANPARSGGDATGEGERLEDRPLKELFEEGPDDGDLDPNGTANTEAAESETAASQGATSDGRSSRDGRKGTASRGRRSGSPGSDPSVDTQVRQLLSLTGPGTQFVLLSPVLDDGAVSVVETWLAFGRESIVLSPDVVPENTVSGQFAAVQRRTRLSTCQATGARTIDWRRGTPLPIALEYAFAADARLGSLRTGGTGVAGGAGGAGEAGEAGGADGADGAGEAGGAGGRTTEADGAASAGADPSARTDGGVR